MSALPNESERIAFDEEGVAEWVAQKTGVVGWMGPMHSLAFYRGGELVGACVYDGFTPYECCLHLAIAEPPVPTWVMHAAFGYPFKQLELRRVTGLIRAGNQAAVDLALRNGFLCEGRKRHALGKDDELIFGLLKEHCPHL